MKLYLVRHAESANNALYFGTEERMGRSPDPEITETGHKQCEKLAQHFTDPRAEPRQHPFDGNGKTDFGLTHIYCSLMIRSMLTADYLAKTCQLSVSALEDLFEKEGVFEFDEQGNKIGLPGNNREYFESRFPEIALPESINPEGWWNRPVETEDEFVLRTKISMKRIRDWHEHTEDCVALIVHGDFIDQCINELMGIQRNTTNYENDWVANWVFHNTSISRIDLKNGSNNVVYLNRIDHLTTELITW